MKPGNPTAEYWRERAHPARTQRGRQGTADPTGAGPNRILGNDRGIALLLTLAIITLLIAVTLEINRKVRLSAATTYTARDQLALRHLAASGTQVAMAILAKDRRDSDTDSLLEDWADPEKVAAVMANHPLQKGKVALKVSDESGRIQVNALVRYPDRRAFNEQQRIIWEELLQFYKTLDDGYAEIDPQTIINAAKDWLDTGDDNATTGLSGAESDYYQGLDPPYSARNGPFAHIAELGLVKGVSPELLHGTAGVPGIADYVTIFGVSTDGGKTAAYSGAVNLNTAGQVVIAALLPVEYKDLAMTIYDYRKLLIDQKDFSAFESLNWYKQAPGCSDLEIDSDLLTAASELYRIEAAATLNGAAMVTETVVRREKHPETGRWICNVLLQEIK
ncbi:MAG: type II secretion system minor pseudopilin GspK [Desulfobacterales bacterium]|nr:type II secretion system minor pseudopilin GspK [Desulfobacterales bacterium]